MRQEEEEVGGRCSAMCKGPNALLTRQANAWMKIGKIEDTESDALALRPMRRGFRPQGKSKTCHFMDFITYK